MNKKEKISSNFKNKDSMEKLFKELGIPFSKNQRQSGTASIRLSRKIKGKQKEE